jgi:hypothetical protein
MKTLGILVLAVIYIGVIMLLARCIDSADPTDLED